jgi:hypothetical protein
MSTVAAHLKAFHEFKSEHHSKIAEVHRKIAKAHTKLSAHYENDSKLSALHKALSEAHDEAGDHHETAGEFHTKCAKSCGDVSTVKAAGGDGVPIGGSGIAPPHADGARKIIRAGQPTDADLTKDVPAEFEEMLKTN